MINFIIFLYIYIYIYTCGPGSSAGIATDYGLDGTGSNPSGDEIFRPSRTALGPTQHPVKWVPGITRGQSAAGACCWPLTPFWCRGHGRVELYLYPPSGPHRACNGTTLPLPLYIHTHTYTHIYIHTHIHTHIHTYIHTHIHTYIHTHIQSVPGGMCQTSGECSLC